MPVLAEVQVSGVKEALKILGDIDKKQRFKAIQNIKSATRELADIARDTYPTEPPLSGMGFKGKFQYAPVKVQRGLKVKIGGRAKWGGTPLVTIVQDDLGAVLYDLAGNAGNRYVKDTRRSDDLRSSSRNNKTFTPNLTGRWGPPQRGMWRAIRQIRRTGYEAILKALEDVAAEANRKLVL